MLDSYDNENSLELHLAVAYIPIIIANTSQNPVDVVQVGKDSFYSFEVNNYNEDISIKISRYDVGEYLVESFETEVYKKMVKLGYEVPNYKYDYGLPPLSKRENILISKILKPIN